MSPRRHRILSGVQPSGKLHLGNYFGAIRQHIALQDEGECFFFIADYHALTTIQDRRQLAENVRGVALDYLALGLDPERTAFFRQSDIPEVTELAWILSTVTGTGLLERAHSYKDKLARGLTASAGDYLRFAGMLLNAGEQVFSELKNLCVWNKTKRWHGNLLSVEA